MLDSNYTDGGYKLLQIGRFGWKRIAKNTQCFGWKLDKVTKVTSTTKTRTYEGKIHDDNSITVNSHDSYSTSKWMELKFSRDESLLANRDKVLQIEWFYNIVYKIRQISLILFVVTFVLSVVISLFGIDITVMSGINMIIMFIWLGLRIAENAMAKSASKYC